MENSNARDTDLAADQKVVSLNEYVLKKHGIVIDKQAKILDFGCGSGRHTYEYLDAGYPNIVGFDARDYTQLRDPSHRDRFRFLDIEKSYRIPFDDNLFDLVTSTSVFEHVINQQETISEIARVLKPTGVTLHVFPSRWRPIEPHIFVPFSGAVQADWWLRLWAWLGIRNQFQRDCSSRETAARNREYCATGLSYRGFKEIDELWKRRFERVEYGEREFIEATRKISKVSQLVYPATKVVPGIINLYRFAHTRVVLAQLPRSAS